jgi:peptidyl-prolyl cis-trans isomerase D
MVNLLRKYQQSILIAITIVIIVSFVLYWNGSQGGRASFGAAAKKASIYGQAVTDIDIQKQVRKFQLANMLGMDDLLQALVGGAQNQQEQYENFLWNSYVFDHEADALQIFPTDKQVQDALVNVPGFQTDGRFDPKKLQMVVTDRLPSLGFSDSVIDELVRQQVRVAKVRELIAAAVTVSPAELDFRFNVENEKMDVSVVRLNLSDVENGINVSDADAKNAYDQHKDSFRSQEQRKVAIAYFELSDADKKLTGKDRTAALEQSGSDAWTFAQSVVDKSADFSALATKAHATKLATTAFFTQAQPDPAFANIPSLADSAYKLSPDYPSSDVLEGENGYYVLHLQGTVPSRQLTFEESKPAIVAELRKEGAKQIMQTKANEVHDRILAALKAGKSFPDAAIASGHSAESVAPFALVDSSKVDVPDIQQIVESAVTLSPGQLSEFASTDAGGLFVYMNSRTPMEKVSASIQKIVAHEQLARLKQMEAFNEWLRIRKDLAHLQIVGS